MFVGVTAVSQWRANTHAGVISSVFCLNRQFIFYHTVNLFQDLFAVFDPATEFNHFLPFEC